MANTKNYTEHGGSVTHIGGELVLDPGSKIIKDGQEIDIGGSLPPVEGSGKVLVSVNGEWEEQDGYGYTEKGNQTVITWDGDTEGKAALSIIPNFTYYRIADSFVSEDIMRGGTITFRGITSEIPEINVMIENTFYGFADGLVLVAKAGVYDVGSGDAIIIPHDGVYFLSDDDSGEYVSSLTYGTPDTVHPIDNKYLSETAVSLVEMNVHWGADDDGWIIDSAPNPNTIAQNILNGKYYILRITSNKYDSISGENVTHTDFLNVKQVRHELINDTLAHVDAFKPIIIANGSAFINIDYFDDSWHWDIHNYNSL